MTILNRDTFAILISEDIAWLLKQPETQERYHIETILKGAVEKYYPAWKAAIEMNDET